MIIANKNCEEIQIIAENNELIASVTDEDIIEKSGYKVVCIPTKD